MKRAGSWIWGLLFIVVGVIWGLNATGVAHFDIFFPGWWTLFIIVPCFVALLTDDNKMASFVGLLIGVCLLLGCWDVLPFDLMWKLALPVVLVLIGCSIIFRGSKKGPLVDKIRTIESGKRDNIEEYWATFGEQNIDYDGKEFKRCGVEAVFGSVNLDLREAKIQQDALVRVSSIFGGVKIRVPEDVKVEVVSTSVFGGVDDERKKARRKKGDDEDEVKDGSTEKEKTLYIRATCVFGGVEIV